ncbi:acyltransferase [Roseateles oligotrophus]|uniref:Acyltransferase n=1 Tax=Roseateles oligotrophus TaxID=1769250 RepID=A0ABT2YDY7_9BURK|nr:acyltransferase [Roseateles oligotrophus]MCV2368271.1 acyltransferase [Roseateles oligotrophus]
MFRSRLNHWRRRLLWATGLRTVFGERAADGRALPHSRIAPSTCIEGERGLSLADHVFIGQFNFIDATAGLQIDEGVQITNFVSIVTHSSHRSIRLLGGQYVSHVGDRPGFVKAPIRIGAYSFVGPHSLIEAGAVLGKGVVISAYSQVRGEVPDFAIMAGQPARQIGDVRAADALLLAAHPWLAVHYEAWAKELPL